MTPTRALIFLVGYAAVIAAGIWFNTEVLGLGETSFVVYAAIWFVFMIPLPIFAIVLELKQTDWVVLRLVTYLVVILATVQAMWLSGFGGDVLWQCGVMIVFGGSVIFVVRSVLRPRRRVPACSGPRRGSNPAGITRGF